MSDQRLRELERRAREGDRDAMARLLAAERQAGRPAPRAAACLDGPHKWHREPLRMVAELGSHAVLYVCAACHESLVLVHERSAALHHADGVLVVGPGRHAAMERTTRTDHELSTGAEIIAQVWRSACGLRIDAGAPVLDLADAHLAPLGCGNCQRSTKLAHARELAPGLLAALVEAAAAWTPPAGVATHEELGPAFDPEREEWLAERLAERLGAPPDYADDEDEGDPLDPFSTNDEDCRACGGSGLDPDSDGAGAAEECDRCYGTGDRDP